VGLTERQVQTVGTASRAIENRPIHRHVEGDPEPTEAGSKITPRLGHAARTGEYAGASS